MWKIGRSAVNDMVLQCALLELKIYSMLVQYSAVQYGKIQCSTVQCITYERDWRLHDLESIARKNGYKYPCPLERQQEQLECSGDSGH